MLGDLKKYENFKSLCEEIYKEMTDFEKEQFDGWKSEIVGLLKNSSNFCFHSLIAFSHEKNRIENKLFGFGKGFLS